MKETEKQLIAAILVSIVMFLMVLGFSYYYIYG